MGMIPVLPPTYTVPESRDNHIPTHIHLPDGRQVSVKSLLDQITNFQTINARQEKNKMIRINDRGHLTRGPARSRPPKYTPEERQWIAHADLDQVCERYNITQVQAYYLINNSRMMLGLSARRRRGNK